MISEHISSLKRHLLNFGGESFQVDDFLEEEIKPADARRLIMEGKLWKSNKNNTILIPLEPCQCHRNTVVLVYLGGGNLTAWWGLALSDDGIWRVHSWARTSLKVIETTTPRLLYYGIPKPRYDDS